MEKQVYADIDIVDENNKPTGKTTDYFDLHENNLCHRAANIWVIENGYVYFQVRGDNVRHPGKYDVCVGGHVDTGESGRQGAVRECIEEVGLDFSEDELGEEFIFRFKQELNCGWFENEFRHTYFVFGDKFNFILNDEVSKLEKIKLVDLKRFYFENENKFVPNNESFYEFVFNIFEKKYNIKFN